ncbi:MAG: DUF4440 domain-containing protein [Terricaulis sp.]
MRLVAVLAMALVLASCNLLQGNSEDPAEANASLAARQQELSVALGARDAAAVAAFYEADARRYLPFNRPQVSQAVIAAGREQLFSDANAGVTMVLESATASGDYGFTEGSFTTTFTNANTSAQASTSGYFLIVWHKDEDGTWKITREVISPGPIGAAQPG